MKYIIGKERSQTAIFPISMEEAINQDHEVRIIDFFVDSLDVEKMGFKVDSGENGRPAYHPKDMLKLYIYGYLNKVRSSRDLEKETKRNIEVIWLLKGLSPDHNTISNFRRDNAKAIKKVFRATVAIAKINEEDYIRLTDMAKAKQGDNRAADIIKNWIRTRTTIEFLGTWESIVYFKIKIPIWN